MAGAAWEGLVSEALSDGGCMRHSVRSSHLFERATGLRSDGSVPRSSTVRLGCLLFRRPTVAQDSTVGYSKAIASR